MTTQSSHVPVQIPPAIGEGPRPRVVHDAMSMAYVFHGLSASDTAEQLNRELKTRETRGSIVSYAYRQQWAKAALNSIPVPDSAQPIEAPRPVTMAPPKIAKPLSELPILPPERKEPDPRTAYVHTPPPQREPEVVDLSTFLPTAPPVFGPVKPEHLHHLHCKWPLGHPGNPSFRHCGERHKPGEAYCDDHCWVAYPHTGSRLPKKVRA